MLPSTLHDLRFAVRMLRKSPVFTVVAVFVITLGTGAVTTIFSMANAVALRPLPGVRNANELVDVLRVRRARYRIEPRVVSVLPGASRGG